MQINRAKKVKHIKDFSEFENKITEAIHIKDETARKDAVKELLLDLSLFLPNSLQFMELMEKFCNMNIDLDVKLKFFMIAFKCAEESFIRVGKSGSFIWNSCFNALSRNANGFNDEVFGLLKSDLDFQREYAKYFKNVDYRDLEKIYKENEQSKELFKLEMFKRIILEDEDFIQRSMSSKGGLFMNLPREYGYLIYLCEDFLRYSTLYSKYFGELLSPEQLKEMEKLQEELYRRPDYYEIGKKHIVNKIRSVLKNTLENKEFFQDLKRLQSNVNLNFESIVNFAHKYYGTEMYNILLSKEEISDELQQKIEYLANSGKKEDTKLLTNIENLTMQDLRDMKKERLTGVKSNLTGGPPSETKQTFFSDGYNYEIRRIDRDGKTDIQECPPNCHLFKLKQMYEGEYESTDSLPIDFCAGVSEKLGSMNLNIENEKCYIYTQENLTKEQKKICIGWLDKANDYGEVGIFVYYPDTKESTPLTENLISVKESIEELLNLGERVTREELDKIDINPSTITKNKKDPKLER